MKSERRVVVTGLGAVTTYGVGVPVLWSSCLAGEKNYCKIPQAWKLELDESRLYNMSPLQLPDYSALNFGRNEIIQYDPASLNMILSAIEALRNAQIEMEPSGRNRFSLGSIDSSRCGVFVGSGMGGVQSLESHFRRVLLDDFINLIEHPLSEHLGGDDSAANDLALTLKKACLDSKTIPRFNPLAIPRLMTNSSAAATAIKLGIVGPVSALSLACATGTACIGQAYHAIKGGCVDVAISGATECLIDKGLSFKAFDLAGTLTSEPDVDKVNRPFDTESDGFLFSQGAAGALILEEYQSAQARGAPILAEIKGFSETFDAHSMVAPCPSMRASVENIKKIEQQSGIPPSEIDYFNAHGTGTKSNDSLEAKFITETFPKKTIVNSTKSLLGHSIAASGAIEAIICVKSLVEGTTHRSMNVNNPLLDINIVREEPTLDIRFAYSQSLAFGGHNAGIMFSKFE